MTIIVIGGADMRSWGVAEAKARFSAVLDRAEHDGPQMVERRKMRFVLMTEEELVRRTHGPAKKKTSIRGETSGKRLWDALRCPPQDGVDVEFPRLKWKPRKVAF